MPATSAGEHKPRVDEYTVTSPMVGTYYSAASPGAKAFVEIGSEIKVGDVALSVSRRVVIRAEIPVELTAVEFSVLECLLRNAGSIVTRETLAERALGRPLAPFDRSVDVHVHNLRKKISATDERIKTIRGIGYMYAPPLEDVE